MSLTRALMFAAFALLGASCATGRVPRIPGDPPPAVQDSAAEDAYQAVLARVSAHQGVYDNLDTKVFFQATWQSPKFVEARMGRRAMFKDIPAAEAASDLEAERKRMGDSTEVFLAVHANDFHFDDLERPESMWRLVLSSKGREVKPLSVERLGRSNVELRSYYSYLESFWVGYLVRFPKVELGAGESMTFKLSSALGKAELVFTAE